MKTVVLDASVVLKWVLPSRFEESHSREALDILDCIQMARLDALQPPHWLAEAAAVLARLVPKKLLTCSIRLNCPQWWTWQSIGAPHR